MKTMIQDDKTTELGLPLPSAGNKLADDVLRIREAFTKVDAKLSDMDEAVKISDADKDARLRALSGDLQAAVRQLKDAIDALMNSKVSTVNGKGGPSITLKPEDMLLGPANGPASTTITYDGTGRVSVLAEILDGAPATSTLAYNEDGTLKSLSTIYRGRTRTQTMVYSSGRLSRVDATEGQA